MSHNTVQAAERRTVHAYLSVRQVREEDLERVLPVGEIDLCTAPVLRDAIEHADSVPNVLVDLSKVNFLALVGVQVLRMASARRTAANRRLVLVASTPSVQRVLTLTDAAEDLEIYVSTRSALSALQS